MYSSEKAKSIVIIFATMLIISSVSVQAEPMKIYLLGGQSNMVGWITSNSDLPSNLQQPQTDVQIYFGGSWDYLRPGLGMDSSRFGPEVTFGRDIADAQPGGNIALIKYAVGGTDLANDWRIPDANGQGGGPQYTTFINIVTDALASLDPLYEPQIVGMIWMQGESDCWHEEDLDKALAYEQNLTNFIQRIRSDVGSPGMSFVIGQISTSSAWTYGDIVRQAQLNVSQTVLNTGLFSTSDLPHDNLHYTSAGTMTLGSRFADEAMSLLEQIDLVGPEDGATVDANGAILSCAEKSTVESYQLLFGPEPNNMEYIFSDTAAVPNEVINEFPYEDTYWTIRVRDNFGTVSVSGLLGVFWGSSRAIPVFFSLKH